MNITTGEAFLDLDLLDSHDRRVRSFHEVLQHVQEKWTKQQGA